MKTGVLLMNTGTPDEPTVEAVARYLHEFFLDPAIIAAPTFIRRMLARHISSKRPERTVKKYEEFWTDDGSPFMLVSKAQAEKLQALLNERLGSGVEVVLAMRYGNPSIKAGIEHMHDIGCEKVVLLPNYPQQVNVCAGTCLKECRAQIDKLSKSVDGWIPEVVEAPSFVDQPAYKSALIASVKDVWTYKPGSKLVVSCHSTLMADIEAGDPYRDQVEATRDFLAEALGVPEQDAITCYQSRFDSRKWLGPFTEATVLQLAADGIDNICIVCPIFTAENIETSLEIDKELRKTFMDAAVPGASFTYVPALNANDGLIEALADAVCDALAGNAPELQTDGIGADKTIPCMLNSPLKNRE